MVETARPTDAIDDAINVTTAPPSAARVDSRTESTRSEPREPERVSLPEAGEIPRRDPSAPRRTIVFEDEVEEELDVPDFLK